MKLSLSEIIFNELINNQTTYVDVSLDSILKRTDYKYDKGTFKYSDSLLEEYNLVIYLHNADVYDFNKYGEIKKEDVIEIGLQINNHYIAVRFKFDKIKKSTTARAIVFGENEESNKIISHVADFFNIIAFEPMLWTLTALLKENLIKSNKKR